MIRLVGDENAIKNEVGIRRQNELEFNQIMS